MIEEKKHDYEGADPFLGMLYDFSSVSYKIIKPFFTLIKAMEIELISDAGDFTYGFSLKDYLDTIERRHLAPYTTYDVSVPKSQLMLL
jgi:hypothetical protein